MAQSNTIAHHRLVISRGGKNMDEKVYLLWFVPEGDNGDDNASLIGVYRTEADASNTVARLRDKPGFRNYPAGFQIHSRVLGEDSWTEGCIYD